MPPRPAAFPRPAAGACCRRWRWARCRCRPARRAGRCTFLQLWRSHLDLTPAQWAERIAACRRLGSREIFLQWVGLEGGRPDDWMAPDAVLGQIFDEAARHGMGVHVGLPYDQRWWNVLATPDDEALARYLDLTREQGLAYMRTAPWSARRNFRGWYLPYELEQYNWASAPARRCCGRGWTPLRARPWATAPRAQHLDIFQPPGRQRHAGTAVARHPGPCARASHDPGRRGRGGPGQPEGAGAAAPLLLARHAPFDLVIELFELPSGSTDGSTFKARSADFERVRKQWLIADSYGAQRRGLRAGSLGHRRQPRGARAAAGLDAGARLMRVGRRGFRRSRGR